MTNADWNAVKAAWGAVYSTIVLMADGHKLTIQTERSGMSLLMAVYVDGSIKGEYMSDEHPIGQKFYALRKLAVYKAKDLKENARLFGKRNRMAKQKWVFTRTPYWRSFTAFKSQLNAQVKTLELITPKPANNG